MNRILTTAPLAAALGLSGLPVALADFVEDSHATIELRNFYMNRDFRQGGAPQSKAEEWGQGFTARFTSGFTEGTIGVGVDAIGQVGLKLDSSADRRGTGLLPFDPATGEPGDDYSELGLTAKLRASKSVLRLGTLQPVLPVVTYNDTRLLSSTFQGGMVTSQEIDGLTLNGGRLTRVNLRDSSGRDELGYGAATSDAFNFAGGSYAVNRELTLSYYYGELEEIYRQHFAGLVHVWPLGENTSLKTDLRYFDSRDEGAKRAGDIDNRNFNGMLTLSHGGHRFSGAWQRMTGDGAFPVLNGGDPYSVNLVTYNTFTREGEDAWQARYDYDFTAMGIPGLSFMTRYVSGRNAQTPVGNAGREWERDTDLAYIVQAGPLKGFSVRWRNLTFRSSNGLTTDIDENRLILGYTLALW